MSHFRTKRFAVGTMGEVFRGNQAEAEQAMKDAGVKAPQKCRCDNPHTYRDEDDELRCLCGRAV